MKRCPAGKHRDGNRCIKSYKKGYDVVIGGETYHHTTYGGAEKRAIQGQYRGLPVHGIFHAGTGDRVRPEEME